MHFSWQTFFQKLLQTEESLATILVPSDPLAQEIATAVIVATSTFNQIFGIKPAAPAPVAPPAPVASPAGPVAPAAS